jgi:UDP-glucose 4-epimerase
LKKVLITGACGYLGARLSKYLAENGYDVTAFDSFDPFGYKEWSSLMEEMIVGDVRDETIISKLADKKFDAVIHCISLDHRKSEDDPNIVSSINVMPTWNLLDRFSKLGLQKFIYFSTSQVYGKVPSIEITEEYQPSPQNNYGLTHLLSENICNYYNENTETECINIRLSNSYGSPVFRENNCWWLVINDLCKIAYKENKIKLLSDGLPQRDFIHSSDICRAIGILINSATDINENTFNVASGQTLTILELAHIVKKVYVKRYKKNINIHLPNNFVSENPHKHKSLNRYVINNKRIQNLGFHPEMSIEAGLNEIFQYLES